MNLHDIASWRAVSLKGEIARIGTPGLPLAARSTVDPLKEKHTMDFALIVSEICFAAVMIASVGVLSNDG